MSQTQISFHQGKASFVESSSNACWCRRRAVDVVFRHVDQWQREWEGRVQMVRDTNALNQTSKVRNVDPASLCDASLCEVGFRLQLLRFLVPFDCKPLEIASKFKWFQMSQSMTPEVQHVERSADDYPTAVVIEEVEHDGPGDPTEKQKPECILVS